MRSFIALAETQASVPATSRSSAGRRRRTDEGRQNQGRDGLDRLGVTGDSRWGKAGLRLAIGGRILFLTAEGVAIAVGKGDIPLFPWAAVTTGLGMLAAAAPSSGPDA